MECHRQCVLMCSAVAASAIVLHVPRQFLAVSAACHASRLPAQVNYMVAPGARIGVGSQDACLTCTFEESGSSAMAELMMKACLRGWAGIPTCKSMGCAVPDNDVVRSCIAAPSMGARRTAAAAHST